VIAWGLIFFLPEETQRTVLVRMSRALKAFDQGSGLGSDVNGFDHRSGISPGADQYEDLLRELGFDIEPGRMDAGENYYYFGIKRG
jgi:hypothetical protein